MKTWLVTGSSRGLGLELVTQIVERGDSVVATARKSSDLPAGLRKHERVLAVDADVADATAVQAAIDAGIDRFGGIDVVINNAGYGMTGAIEEVSDEEARAVFDTNVFGVLNVVRAVLPHLRARRAGRIVNIGSVSGLRGIGGNGVYSATKHALEGLTEALAQEVAPFGIGVCVAELGAVRTGFLAKGAIRVPAAPIVDYADGPAGFVAGFVTTGHGRQLGDVVATAALIIDAAIAPRLPVHLPVGPDALLAVDALNGRFDEALELWGDRAGATGHPDGGGGAPAR